MREIRASPQASPPDSMALVNRAVSILLLATMAARAHGATTVGRVEGSFDTTATGGATYTVPIQVAAGMNGLKPAIALSFGSQTGDGLAGTGWTLSGFSEITRCPLSRAVDGRTQGVRFTAQDRFCLDGHPLILLSGVYGGAGAQYRTEVHDHARLTSSGQQGTGPSWFELRSPDGLVYRYGNDADSRAEAPGTNEVRAWALNEIEDKFGQRVGFSYAEDTINGEHHPVEVRWTYGAGEPRYRLLMSWEPRPAEDVREGYVWGSPWRSSERLSAIDYEFDAGSGYARVHRYSMSYAPPPVGRPRSRLAGITQCGRTQCLPATTIEWDERSDDRVTETITTIPIDKSVFGDYNGDGATDVFGGYQGLWAVWRADPQTGGFLAPLMLGGAAFNDTSVGIPLEYDGDGLTDLMIGSSQAPTWTVLLSPAPGGSATTRNTGVSWSATTEVEPMDIDADGLDDLVYLRDGMVYVRRNTGAALGAEQPSGIRAVAPPLIVFTGGHGFVKSADFDGDGRRDLLVSRSQVNGSTFVWEAFLSTGSGFASEPIATLTTSPNRWNTMVLDLNGDGLSDVLKYGGGSWQPLISRGTNSGATPGLLLGVCPAPLTQAAGNKAAPLDVDGDGRAELLIQTGTGWRLHRSRGNCFSSVENYIVIINPNSLDYGRVMPIDANGDGNTDIMFGSASRLRWVLSRPVLPTRPDGLTPAYRADLLRRISDGLGNSHELFHQPLSGWSGYTASGASTAQTRLLRGGPIFVLSRYAANTGAASATYSVAFNYANARLDTQGRGLLGFQTIRAEDSRNALVTETNYRQDFPFAMRPDKVTVWNGAMKVLFYDPTWSSTTTSAPDPALDTHFVHLTGDLSETYEVDADGGYQGNLVRSASRALTWDPNHGAVVTEQTTVSAPQQPGTAHRTTRTVILDEGLRSSAGCLGFADRIDVTKETSGGAAQTRTVQMSYDIATCRMATRTEGPPGVPAQQLRTSYAYDARGRLQSTVSTDGTQSAPPRQVRLSYDAAGFRPLSESRVIAGEPDLLVTHAWNDGLGLEVSRTSPQGLTTAWGYDEFGRVNAELRPTGGTVTNYAACGPCFAANARYAVRQTRIDGYWSETQHDSFGRVVGRAFVLPDGRASRQVVEFDTMGRVMRESVPYVEDAASIYWTRYDYDLIGRPKSIDRPVNEAAPSGALSSFLYAGLTTTVRDAGLRTTSYAYDAEGRITQVTPPLGGGAAYSYDAFGGLASVLDAAGHSRQFGYDQRGLLTQSIDPDAGQRSFTYNAFGELLTLTDGKSPSNTMTLQYDQLGRLTRRIEPEGTTIWTYSAIAGRARGQLHQVTGPTDASATGFQESYAYDAAGRVHRTITTIDGTSYQTDYTYDVEGKVISMTCPTTIGWRPQFSYSYSKGHLVRIIDGLTLTQVYSLLGMDASGRDTAVRFGNTAIERRETYDAASTRVTAISAGPPANPTTVQNYAYEWDRVGNLLMRQDRRANPQLEERFAYDDLDRLTQATLNGAPTLTMTYAPDGNVISKSDVGNYTYGLAGALSHAVTAVSGGPRGTMSFAYDANGNMTGRNGASITWTSFNLPRQVNAGADYARFTYGPRRARIRQELKVGTRTKTIHYVGPHFEVEIEGGVRRYRANASAYGRAVYSQLETTPNGLEGYYVLHDHQGSVDRLVRAVGTGADTLAQSFDAWGKRRNTNWTADPADVRFGDSHWTERGFTGHEHLDNVRLIHMNARLEDPILGRMLAPDPVLGNVANPQTLNPYSYVANRPASFADPSGYFLNRLWKGVKRAGRSVVSFGQRLVQRWGRQIAAGITAYYGAGAVSSWASAAQLPDIAVSIGGPALFTEGIAVAGTLTAAVPSSVVLGGMAGGALAGAIMSGNAQGGAFGALTGGITAGIGGYYAGAYNTGRVLAEASVGGVAGELQGGDFATGLAVSGTLASLTWASLEMRRAMIESSRLDPAGRNEGGISDGFRGDAFKLGGCRAPCRNSPLGGVQGGPGRIFGRAYEPGSFVDHVVETYAGPHDFLNAPFFYDALGNSIDRPAILGLVNAANVVVATPFAAASVVPPYVYPVLD
jgi:RHS repeat-associated protein